MQRIKLFVGYVDERAKGIHNLNADASAQNKAVRMHNLFDEFTRLSDDLEDNMDNFNDEHADLRKELKEVSTRADNGARCSTSPRPATNTTLCARRRSMPTRACMKRPYRCSLTKRNISPKRRRKKRQQKRQEQNR